MEKQRNRQSKLEHTASLDETRSSLELEARKYKTKSLLSYGASILGIGIMGSVLKWIDSANINPHYLVDASLPYTLAYGTGLVTAVYGFIFGHGNMRDYEKIKIKLGRNRK